MFNQMIPSESKGDGDASKTDGEEGEFEFKPQRTRTSNLLIKSHKPALLSDTRDSLPISDIQKYSRDLCFTFYLLLRSIGKFIGNMLATQGWT